MKLNKLFLILPFLYTLLFSASWEISPNNEWVYSTNSGVKLKAAAGINDETKKLCFLVEKEDGTDFKYDITLYIQFANGEIYTASSGPYYNNSKQVYKCFKYDIPNMAGYEYTYSDLAQGPVKIWAKSANGDVFNFPDFNLKAVDPIKITSYSIEKVNEDDNYEYFKMSFSLSKEPIVVKVESDIGRSYYFLKNGSVPGYPSDIFYKLIKSSDKKNWTIYFKIKKSDNVQNKYFKLIVQDYRAKSDNDLVASDIRYFAVDKKLNYTFTIKPDSLSKKVPADFNFIITTNYKVDGVKVTTSKGEEKVRHRDNFGTFGAIQIEPVNDTTWNVKYHVNSVYPFDANENNITLNFYLLDSDNNVLAQKSIKVNVYKNKPTNEDLSKIIDFLNKSPILKKLNLGDKNKRYHHLSRAEAAIILYEFLKLKNPNFKLPYDIEFYNNPFSDIDKNTNYYKAVITLTNYNGSDNVAVLTKKYGVFNPLENVSRFQFVKMIIEGLDIPKTDDFSYIQNYDDVNGLAYDAKVYYSTAVKEGIIKGDNNKLLPYSELTIFQALTILERVLNRTVNVNENQFELPLFDNEKIGNPLGILPDNQDYDPTIIPIKINKIEKQKEGNCTKLTVISTIDDKAKGKDYYVWSANFGYFEKNSTNNKTVIFCPSTKEPSDNFIIKVIGTDGYMNFDEKTKVLYKNEFNYTENIGNRYPNELEFNISLSLNNNILKENKLFSINMQGSLYKDGLKIGLEKVAVELVDNNKTYYIDNVKWDNNSIYFIVPTIKELYGKNIKMRVLYGTNYKSSFKDFDVLYKPLYVINGQIEPDISGNYPSYVKINNQKVNVDKNSGLFSYIASDSGKYKIYVDNNYSSININLTDKNPVANVYISYIYTPSLPVVDENNTTDKENNNTEVVNQNNSELPDFSMNNITYTFDFSNLQDFNKTNWINIDNADMSDGYLKLIHNYDNDPHHYVKYLINTEGASKLILEKETKLSANDEYTKSSTAISNSKEERLYIVYNNYHYNNGDLYHQIDVNNTEHFYLFNRWDYKNSNDFKYKISKLLKPIWNKWFYEKLVIDYDNKVATYFISTDGVNYQKVSINDIHLQRDENTTIVFEAWDWSSGSTHDIKKLKIELIKNDKNNNKIEIKLVKGWNLVSLPINVEIPITDFNQSDVKIIWKWNNLKKEWMVWSPNENILNLIKKYKFEIIKNISAKDGFWVYLNNKLDTFINVNNPINQMNSLILYKGWNLVGFDRDINITIFDNDGVVEYLWKYDVNNSNWKLHISNGKRYPLNVKKFNIIKNNEGVWIKVSEDINLSIDIKEDLPFF